MLFQYLELRFQSKATRRLGSLTIIIMQVWGIRKAKINGDEAVDTFSSLYIPSAKWREFFFILFNIMCRNKYCSYVIIYPSFFGLICFLNAIIQFGQGGFTFCLFNHATRLRPVAIFFLARPVFPVAFCWPLLVQYRVVSYLCRIWVKPGL